MIKIMGLDQATKKSAFSVFMDDKYSASGAIDLSKMKDTNERVQEMGRRLCDTITAISPDVLFIEDVQSQSNPNTMKILARLQGELMGFAYANKIPIYILQPTVWRKCLLFRQGPKVEREELKQQSIDYVHEHYGLDVDDDTADAICIATAGYQMNYKH